MKKSFLLILLLWSCFVVHAQYYTREFNDRSLSKKAHVWLNTGVWRHDFQKASPHRSVNICEFYMQYSKNTSQWTALFRWLADTDLLTIPAGKYPIVGTTLVASVEDSQNGPLGKRNSESHYHHIDFQYVVKGVERFGIIDHLTSVPKDMYKPDVIHYNYNVTKTRFYDSNPKEFFLFFPSDWHIAKIESPKSKDQNIRVVVVKVDYIE